MKSVEKYVLEPSDIGDMAENSIENLGIEPSALTDIGVNSIASHALEPSAMMEIGVNTIASHAREPSDIGDMVENSIEKHELESSEIRDIEMKSFANHALEPSAILEIGLNSIANHAHEPSAIMDKGVNTTDTNSMQILNGADCLKSIIAGDVSVEPVCEDGELCVCEVSTGVKPQKRKSGRQKVQERKTKRHCSGKSGCENEVEIENKRSRHTNRELKESYKNLRNRISKLTADVLMLEKLRNQVNDRRSHCRKQGEKLSQTFTQTKKTVGKGKSERLKFSLPDFDSFIDDSVSGGPSDENNVTNDLNYREPVFLTGSVSFDMNLDKDVCEDSDDDDLPVGLTPIKIEKFFQEKDIVWVKWKGWPYLPAMVKRVYKKKKRMTCLVFTPEDKPEKPWSVSTAGGKVWSYFDERKKEEILKASETLEQSQREYFKDCMARLEMYLTRKALGQIKDDYAYLNQDGKP